MSETTVHHDDTTKLIDASASHLGHPDPVRDVRRIGSINDVPSSESEQHCYERLSSSVSSVSSVVPELHVYRRRWYILFIFTLLSIVQVQTGF